MNNIISIQQAIILKEKDFSVPVPHYYIGETLMINTKESNGECEYSFDSDDFAENWNIKDWVIDKQGNMCFGCKLDNKKWFEGYSAPKQYQVVQWLNDKHGIWIYVYPDGISQEGWYFGIYKNASKDRSYYFSKYHSEVLDLTDSQTVYSAAIDYVLDNLL